MTAKTSQHLADTLRTAGFEDLAKRAEADEFHDFLSDHTFPEMELDKELHKLTQDESLPVDSRAAAQSIRARHHQGEFDSSVEESDEWAESDAGKEAFRRLAGGE